MHFPGTPQGVTVIQGKAIYSSLALWEAEPVFKHKEILRLPGTIQGSLVGWKEGRLSKERCQVHQRYLMLTRIHHLRCDGQDSEKQWSIILATFTVGTQVERICFILPLFLQKGLPV